MKGKTQRDESAKITENRHLKAQIEPTEDDLHDPTHRAVALLSGRNKKSPVNAGVQLRSIQFSGGRAA